MGSKVVDSHFFTRFLSNSHLSCNACIHGESKAQLVFGLSPVLPKQTDIQTHQELSTAPAKAPAMGEVPAFAPTPCSLTALLLHKHNSQKGPQAHLHGQGVALDQAISSLHVYSLATAAFDPILFVS